ncbi:protein of unknown function [Bradyrhizobium vignae]|uniref:Uncharacterized protein n=1 Tax=Bradyrhizobium vignae TaxID=1549949 RepID=A0A2U3PU10_9BRAD|nr:protein of unknown function [Bradyrhizobium vignae]
MASDNIAGVSGSILKKLYLFPGMVIQWTMYVSVGSKSYSQTQQQTRLARSPFMTFAYSSMFWLALAAFLLGALER